MQHLSVKRFSKNGAYLIDSDDKEVLLPNRYVDDSITLNSLVWVFVYMDSDDRIVAITTEPKAFVGDIATLKVVGFDKCGIYLDIGIPKDIFMPSKNPMRFTLGQNLVVKIALDKQNRLIARQNVTDYLIKAKLDSNFKYVNILPFLRTEIGFNCVVNGKFFGIIHNNDINKTIMIGESIKGVVKKIRADGKLDLGILSDTNNAREAIMSAILANGGILNLHFHSSSDEIKNALGISKKTFKSAINALVRAGKIRFYKTGFILVK